MAKVTDATRNSAKEFDFSSKDFNRVRELIYKRAGISLADSKQEMVYSRLARRLRVAGLNSFSVYLDDLEKKGTEAEWEAFINALTTNLTAFFREEHHFPLLAAHVQHRTENINVWCAASSTGEEPYSIAITLCETFNKLNPPVSIIATDIDTNVLATAVQGVYALDKLEKMSPERMRKFFLKGKGEQEGLVRVRPEIRKLVSFKQLNLLEDAWGIKGSFDAIFCRNVMIYFDKQTQKKILQRFAPLLKADGLLFAGHSENFSYLSDDYKLRGKTVYELMKTYAMRQSAGA